VLALFVVGTLVAVSVLTSTSGAYLSSTGQTVGQPRDRIADLDTDLPDPPDWLP
jgi:hypothetical protein